MFKWLKEKFLDLVAILTTTEVRDALVSSTIGAVIGAAVGLASIYFAGPYWVIVDITASILLGTIGILIVIPWLESSRFSKLAEVL